MASGIVSLRNPAAGSWKTLAARGLKSRLRLRLQRLSGCAGAQAGARLRGTRAGNPRPLSAAVHEGNLLRLELCSLGGRSRHQPAARKHKSFAGITLSAPTGSRHGRPLRLQAPCGRARHAQPACKRVASLTARLLRGMCYPAMPLRIAERSSRRRPRRGCRISGPRQVRRHVVQLSGGRRRSPLRGFPVCGGDGPRNDGAQALGGRRRVRTLARVRARVRVRRAPGRPVRLQPLHRLTHALPRRLRGAAAALVPRP